MRGVAIFYSLFSIEMVWEVQSLHVEHVFVDVSFYINFASWKGLIFIYLHNFASGVIVFVMVNDSETTYLCKLVSKLYNANNMSELQLEGYWSSLLQNFLKRLSKGKNGWSKSSWNWKTISSGNNVTGAKKDFCGCFNARDVN